MGGARRTQQWGGPRGAMSTGGFQVDPGGDNVSDDHGGGKILFCVCHLFLKLSGDVCRHRYCGHIKSSLIRVVYEYCSVFLVL